MQEYMKEWESYVAEHYKPNNMTMHELCELEKISDIMKDMAEYWSIKSDMARMMGER